MWTLKEKKEKYYNNKKKVRNYIYKKCANKTTGGKDNSSIRKVVALANKKFKLSKDPKKRLSISKVQKFLYKKFQKPRKLIKKPLVKESYIKKKKLTKYIIDEEIPYKNIFFTMKKNFW